MGRNAARELSQSPSSRTMRGDRERCLQVGRDELSIDAHAKPVTQKQLQEAIIRNTPE